MQATNLRFANSVIITHVLQPSGPRTIFKPTTCTTMSPETTKYTHQPYAICQTRIFICTSKRNTPSHDSRCRMWNAFIFRKVGVPLVRSCRCFKSVCFSSSYSSFYFILLIRQFDKILNRPESRSKKLT